MFLLHCIRWQDPAYFKTQSSSTLQDLSISYDYIYTGYKLVDGSSSFQTTKAHPHLCRTANIIVITRRLLSSDRDLCALANEQKEISLVNDLSFKLYSILLSESPSKWNYKYIYINRTKKRPCICKIGAWLSNRECIFTERKVGERNVVRIYVTFKIVLPISTFKGTAILQFIMIGTQTYTSRPAWIWLLFLLRWNGNVWQVLENML